jgi:two-component system, cell cycle sensor histidine kinase and response regulator CckA
VARKPSARTQLTGELRAELRAELEQQNEALRYSQRMAEGALERFATLFSNVPLALLVVDENSLVLESNTMALSHFRPEERDPPLNFLFPLVLPQHLTRVVQAFAEAKDHGASRLEGVVFTSGSAQLTADLHIARVENPLDDLANFICAVVDQGPLLAQIAQKETLEAQLRESQKMQAIGTLAGGIAHDFNNILGAILGNVELARLDAAGNSAAQASLVEIEKAGRRARDLVSQILTFSRNEPLARSAIDLAGVAQETARLVKFGLPPAIDLRVECGAVATAVLADATQVQQALLNLCTNAVQAIGADRGSIGISLAVDGAALRIAVSDTGAGMDIATQARVFEPFFTTKPTGQGTGLGLSVVHGIMRSHDGAVSLQSTPGLGSVFTLSFPLAVGVEPLAAAQEASPFAAVDGAGQHIMYVDDDQALVFLVQRALTRRGYRVSSFTDPRLAIQDLKAEPEAFDLLVTDYNMPGFSGIELLREAKAIRADLPVALASGYVTAEIERSAMAAGASALIRKPNGVDELADVVQRLVHTKVAA